MNLMNNVFFIALPYTSIVVFLLGSIYRYKNSGFQYSSLSSQFLEGNRLFWSTLPFHFGLLVILLGHFLAFLFPRTLLLWNSKSLRLVFLEGIGIIFGLCALIGIVALLHRRLFNDRVKVVSSKMDIFIELLIMIQIILGVWVALYYRWGSSWFAIELSPYLWSIFLFAPEIDSIVSLPIVVQFHIIIAFCILLIFPFTRLVHLLVVPLHYIFRPYQQFIWYWNRKIIRHTNEPWSPTKPKNN